MVMEAGGTAFSLSKYLDKELITIAAKAVSGTCPLYLALYDLDKKAVWTSEPVAPGISIPQDLSENATLARAAETLTSKPRTVIRVDEFANGVIMAPILLEQQHSGFLAGFRGKERCSQEELAAMESVVDSHARLLAHSLSGKRAIEDLVIELSNRYEELALVYAVSNALDINKSLSETLESVCEPVLTTMEADLLILRVPGHGLERYFPYDPMKVDQWRALAKALGRKTEGEECAIVNSLKADQALVDLAEDFSHAAVVPLNIDGVPGRLILLRANEHDRFYAGDGVLLEGIGRQLAGFITNIRIASGRRQLLYASIFGLSRLAESRDPETGEHLQRVSRYVRRIAEYLQETDGYSEETDKEFVENVFRASPLHDIGKVGIPDSILCKPGKLSPEEFEIMKTHSVIGGDTVRDIELRMRKRGGAFIVVAREIAYSHHEKWDGSGYPHGLAGAKIPLAARIMALADVYDALTSKRCYKPAFPHEKARDIIVEGSGSHFEPAIVDAFLAMEDHFADVSNLLRDPELK